MRPGWRVRRGVWITILLPALAEKLSLIMPDGISVNVGNPGTEGRRLVVPELWPVTTIESVAVIAIVPPSGCPGITGLGTSTLSMMAPSVMARRPELIWISPTFPGPTLAVWICPPLIWTLPAILEFGPPSGVAVIEMLPPAPAPVVRLWMEAPSICTFEAVSCTSAPASAPEFDETIELPGLSEIVCGGPGLSAVLSTASFTEITNCPPRIETVCSPLTLMFEPGASETDPKELYDVLFTFGSGWSVAASNSPGDAALANCILPFGATSRAGCAMPPSGVPD